MSFRLDGVGLTHANGFTALAEISLQAKQGERIALIGPSGAGKTSLLSVIGTALTPTAGRASVLDFADFGPCTAPQRKHPWGAGVPSFPHPKGTSCGVRRRESSAERKAVGAPLDSRIRGNDLKSLRARIGTVHQAPPIPGRQRAVTAVLAGKLGQWPAWKSLASLLYPLDLPGARAALARVDLADKLFSRCDQLSGGQLQRVGIARVLYQQPDLMLADEPVSALDPALALATIRLLTADAEARGATLVASLHAVDLALGNFPRIVGVKAGRIAFDLPSEQVTVPMLHELYASEGEQLPIQAHESHLLPQAAANDAATRAACC